MCPDSFNPILVTRLQRNFPNAMVVHSGHEGSSQLVDEPRSSPCAQSTLPRDRTTLSSVERQHSLLYQRHIVRLLVDRFVGKQAPRVRLPHKPTLRASSTLFRGIEPSTQITPGYSNKQSQPCHDHFFALPVLSTPPVTRWKLLPITHLADPSTVQYLMYVPFSYGGMAYD